MENLITAIGIVIGVVVVISIVRTLIKPGQSSPRSKPRHQSRPTNSDHGMMYPIAGSGYTDTSSFTSSTDTQAHGATYSEPKVGGVGGGDADTNNSLDSYSSDSGGSDFSGGDSGGGSDCGGGGGGDSGGGGGSD